MQNMWTDNSSTAYSSAEAVKQERIFMIYCCYISKGYKVNNVITFSCPCLWAATNCIWQWPSLPPSLDWETLSWQSPHFQRLKIDNWAKNLGKWHRTTVCEQLLPEIEKAQSVTPQTSKFRYRRVISDQWIHWKFKKKSFHSNITFVNICENSMLFCPIITPR